MKVNPQLIIPKVYTGMMEYERKILTRYRCGSHNLNIETGSMFNIPRDERICDCMADLQTLQHCLFDCPMLADIRSEYNFTTIQEAMESKEIVKFLLKLQGILKISSS